MNPNGNGLGLSICKSICNNLGGDITLCSQPGEMTEFTFWVSVKIPGDCDISEVMSPRAPKIPKLPEGRTKDDLTVLTIVNQPTNFGALIQGKKLCIICADDVYYNLETLRIVFA